MLDKRHATGVRNHSGKPGRPIGTEGMVAKIYEWDVQGIGCAAGTGASGKTDRSSSGRETDAA